MVFIFKALGKDNNCIRYFVFFAVPDAFENSDRSSHTRTLHVWDIDSGSGSDRNNDLVLRSIAKFIDGKEQIIPTSIRLVTAKKPLDLFRESLARTTYATFEISSGFAEGEVDGGQVAHREIRKAPDRYRSQIERGSQVLHSSDCVLCETSWNRFNEFELMPFMDAIRIRLDDMSARCSLEIEPRAPLKAGKAFLSPSES